MDIPPFKLETERCFIIPLSERHSESFMEYRNDPEIAKYQSWDPDYTSQQIKEFIQEFGGEKIPKSDDWCQLAIEEKSTGILLGDIALFLFDEDRQANIGVTLSNSSQKQGYATECVGKVLKWAFDSQPIHRISVTIDAGNIPSIKLFQRLGFRKEAHLVENIWFKGDWGSEVILALLRKEYSKFISQK